VGSTDNEMKVTRRILGLAYILTLISNIKSLVIKPFVLNKRHFLIRALYKDCYLVHNVQASFPVQLRLLNRSKVKVTIKITDLLTD